MKNKFTIRNHYLPITYTKHFLNKDDELFVYQKGKKFFETKKSPNERILAIKGQQALRDIGLQKKLYHPEGISNKDMIEDFFTTEIDNHYDYLLNVVRQRETQKRDFEQGLRFLISTAMVRTPDFKKRAEEIGTELRKKEITSFINNEDLFNAWVNDYEKRTGKILDEVKKEKVQKMYNEQRYDLKWGNNLFLGLAFMSIKEHGELLSSFNLSILIADPKSFFITSDAPVVYFVPKDKVNFYHSPKSLKSKFTEIYFPLSKEFCILLSHKTEMPKYIQLNREQTRNYVNYNIAHNSRDFIISPYKASFLDKFVENYIPYPFKFKIY